MKLLKSDLKNILIAYVLFCISMLGNTLVAQEYSFGNERLTLTIGADGLLKNASSYGTNLSGDFSELGSLFRVELLENVYGLEDGTRRTLDLRPIAEDNGVITLVPETESLPQFTFTTIDKGAYFVLELTSMQNPTQEHAIELTMVDIDGTYWLPLDSVTKKTTRRGNNPTFMGVLQRSPQNPLGSIAMWTPGEDWDDVLYQIWTTEDIPHPKVDGEWTIERAQEWIAEYISVIRGESANESASQGNVGYHNQMIIGPKAPEDLQPLVDVATAFGMNYIYMHLNSWAGRYWPSDRDNWDVNLDVFSGGQQDMFNFADSLQSEGKRLTYRTLSYGLGLEHPEYLAKDNINTNLASWWQGTLAGDIDTSATEITVAQGNEHFTHYDADRRWSEIFNMKLMQIGNELVTFQSYVNNGDGTWTLHGCVRGIGRTEAVAHTGGEVAKGLYRIYGQALAPDPDSILLEEMAQRHAQFLNDTKAAEASFDGVEVHEMMYYYGDTKYTGEVYSRLDHPVLGSTSGAQLTWGFYETLFNAVRDVDNTGGLEIPIGIPYAADMKIGLHQSHWNASSPYAYAWAIPANAAAGNAIQLSGQDGFQNVTMEMINNHGLVDHYAQVCNQWSRWGSDLPTEIKERIFSSWRALPGQRYSLVDETFRFEGEEDNLYIVPFRMLMQTNGLDKTWTYFQEHGTVYPYQYFRPGQSETMVVHNPYHCQNPEFIIRVMSDFDREITEGSSHLITPDPSAIVNKGIHSFDPDGAGVRISVTNDASEVLTVNQSEALPGYSVNTGITGAGGLGVVVTGDGSNALLVIRVSGEGTRDYIVPLDFTGQRYVEIASPQVSWTNSRWGFVDAHKRWRGNWIRNVNIWLDQVPANTTSSIVVEDIRFLPEQASALVNPSIAFGDGSLEIDGTIPSDRYLWYQGGSTVGVYDLNWNKLEDLRVKGTNSRSSVGDIDISITNNNGGNDPWLEVQFFAQDRPMSVLGNGTLAAADIQVTGNGLQIDAGDFPEIALGTDFGQVTSPVSQLFTITNQSSSTTLNLTGSPYVTLTSGSGFTLTQDASIGAIPPLGSTTFEITYDAGVGLHTAQVSIASSDPNLPAYTFDIQGFSFGEPVVVNQGATVGDVSATLEGQLTQGARADAIIYWGTSDGGTTPGNWEHAETIGSVNEGEIFSSELTGLVSGRQYYYRCYTSNAKGEAWATSTTPFQTAIPTALPVTMVRWGAPGGEDILTADVGVNSTSTYDPVTPRSPALGSNGYYITDMSNRTPVIYGAHQANLEFVNSGTTDSARLAKYMAIGETFKAMLVWKKEDFKADLPVTVTNLKLNISGPTDLSYENRWVVEKAGQFYISDQTFATGDLDVDASTLTWSEYTPLNGGVDSIGAAASITLYDLDSIGFYITAERTAFTEGNWMRPSFNYFAVDGDEDPDLSATVYYVNYVAGPNGSISGEATQEVLYNGSTTAVTAIPDANYEFTGWSDGSTATPRSDDNVTTSQTYTAQFAVIPPVVVNVGATGSQGGATLEGQLTQGGSADAWIYWGASDGGTTAGNWDNAESIGSVTAGETFSKVLSDLVVGRQYYYRCYVSDSNGNYDWAESTGQFTTEAPVAQSVTMVRWGAPGGEDIVTANTSKNSTGTYDPATPRSPELGGAEGYYVTDMTNRTPVIYGAHQALLEIRNNGTADYAWLAKYMSVGNTMKNMIIWKKEDFKSTLAVTVTNLKLNLSGPTDLVYQNRWVVEKSGQFYISDQTFTTGDLDVDVSTLTWSEYTPLNGGVDSIGAAAAITLYDLDSVGFYINAERTAFTEGNWMRPSFNYFAVEGLEDPDLSATVNYVNYVAGPNGSISGEATQEVLYDGSTTAVSAIPDANYEFTGWSDGSTANPRSDANVTSTQTYTANFAVIPPAVTNIGATGTQGGATLEGQLTQGVSADAIIYWGASDGGTTPADWDNAESLGSVTEGVTFTKGLTGLVSGRQYYYRCYVSNANGSDWAETTGLFKAAKPEAQPVTMVRWGASGGEDILNANVVINSTGTYDPAVPRSPALGAGGYYITDMSNRTPVIYGAHQCNLEFRNNGTADYTWLAKYMALGDTFKAMLVWKKQDFLAERSVTVTRLKLNFSGPADLGYTNRWIVEKSGQFYISDQTFTTGDLDVDATTLTWSEYTPLNGGVDSIGAAAAITLYDLDSVGFYVNVERTAFTQGNWMRPSFNHFTVEGLEDPDLSATVNYVHYAAGPNGSITGTTTQEVSYGGSTTSVAATPNAGYEFVDWSDGSTANPRSDTNVTSSQTYTANFAPIAPVVVYVAGPNGSIIGAPPITVSYTDQETDIVNTGVGNLVQAQNFGGTGSVTINGILHANNNSALTPASFPGPWGNPDSGTFTGDMFKLLDGIAGSDTAAASTVTISGLTPGETYLFQAYWLVNDNFGTRTMNVNLEGETLTNISANTAANEFVLISYTYTATDDTFVGTFEDFGGNEWLQGFSLQVAPEPASITTQEVPYGGSTTPVTATPDAGYEFVDWSDGSTANPRSDTNVTSSQTYTANFALVTLNQTSMVSISSESTVESTGDPQLTPSFSTVDELINSGYIYTITRLDATEEEVQIEPVMSEVFEDVYIYQENDAGYMVGYVISNDTTIGMIIDPDDNYWFTATLGGTISTAESINNDNLIVGSATDVDENSRAVIWDLNNTVIDLNSLLSEEDAQIWMLEYAVDISDDGVIIGVGTVSGERAVFELK